MPKKAEKQEKTEKKEKKKEEKAEILIEDPIQPEINIGLVGHVDHGKTTLTEKLTGKWTDTHSEEIKRGITIRLGYADSLFRKCPDCEGYKAYTTKLECPGCGKKSIPLRKVSFVDAPGHESLMATMLSGAAIMDGALLLIAANEKCPQPQTREHLMALQICGIKNIVIVQNKIDLVSEEDAIKNYNDIKKFLKGTPYENSLIIPVSAHHNVNMGALVYAIEKSIPTPHRDPNKEPIMFIARSFDINKPGTLPEKLQGGILGGALRQGKLKSGDMIELRPGRITQEQNKIVAKPITTEIISLMTGGKNVNEVTPGGSIGLLTKLDPGIVKADSLTGNIVGLVGKLPNILYHVKLNVHLLERVVGSKEDLTVEPIKMAEILMLNVNSAATVGFVTKLSKNDIECRLKIPICAENKSRITISRRIGNRFRLIGYGILKD